MLRGANIVKYFGGLAALNNVSFTIDEEEIVGLIGPNGSGKTTLFNCISGVCTPTSGKIFLDKRDITNMRPDKICKLGIARTYQEIRLFPNLTVFDNVLIGALFGKSRTMSEAKKKALDCLYFVGLADKRDVLAKNLKIYDKKMTELARALATSPSVLLIDEVAAGLNATEVANVIEIIKRIRSEFGISIFWIEHVMSAIMKVAERIMVLNQGVKIAEGPPKAIAQEKGVIDAYLGKEIE